MVKLLPILFAISLHAAVEPCATFSDRVDAESFPSWYVASLRDLTPPTNTPIVDPQFTTPELQRDEFLLWHSETRIAYDLAPNFYFRNIGQHFLVANTNASLMFDVNGNRLPQFDEPAGVASLDMLNAWAVHKEASNVVVVLIDTGMDGTHPDLTNTWVTWTEPSALIDTDGHGTEVAGVVGAIGGNGIGISGVARGVKLWPVKMTTYAESSVSMAISNVVKCARTNLDLHFVVNMSFGYQNPSSEPLKVKHAIEFGGSNNVLFTVAAINATDGIGNQDAQSDYPTSWQLPNVISVGGHTRQDTLYSYIGTNIDVMAGARLDLTTCRQHLVQVNNAQTNFTYTETNAYTGGTSFASPQVAGVAALKWSQCPTMSNHELRLCIMDTVVQLPVYGGTCKSGGRVDAYRVLVKDHEGLSIGANGVFASRSNGVVSTVQVSTNLIDWDYASLVVTNDGFPIRIGDVTNIGNKFFRFQ